MAIGKTAIMVLNSGSHSIEFRDGHIHNYSKEQSDIWIKENGQEIYLFLVTKNVNPPRWVQENGAKRCDKDTRDNSLLTTECVEIVLNAEGSKLAFLSNSSLAVTRSTLKPHTSLLYKSKTERHIVKAQGETEIDFDGERYPNNQVYIYGGQQAKISNLNSGCNFMDKLTEVNASIADSPNVCRICFCTPIDSCALPCKHASFCKKCLSRCEVCPLCKSSIVFRLELRY